MQKNEFLEIPNIDTFNVKVDFTDSINAASMKRLIKRLARSPPNVKRIHVILDNAGYCCVRNYWRIVMNCAI
ncbi:MAG: hypothetical protein LBP59_07565 [Planctomycetaceae bacterium]|nr:hypothetical protein [Planctomycetaceae bacterium]